MSEEGYVDHDNEIPEAKGPTFDYKFTNNSIMFNNPIQNTSGFSDDATFNANVIVDNTLTVKFNKNIDNFVPVVLPNDTENNLNIPAINSLGTIQSTDILSADNGKINFYSCSGNTYLYDNINLNGTLYITQLSQITGLQEVVNTKPDISDVSASLNSKLNLSDAYTSSTVNSLLDLKSDVSTSTVTTSSLLTLIDNKPNISDVSTGLNGKLSLLDA